jgi:phosphoenolpyruvate carboxykinase (ATP)
VAQPPNHRQPDPSPSSTRSHSRPGARQSLLGMLSSLPIGRATPRRPTPLYTLTPLPRVRKGCRLGVISPSRSRSLLSPVFPSRKWIPRKPTLPSSTQLPRPLSTLAPKPPDLELDRKHLRTMKDPVARTASPYTDPSVKGPRSQLLSRQHPFTPANSTSTGLAIYLFYPSALPSLTPAFPGSARQHCQQDRPPSRWHHVSASPFPLLRHWRS